MGNKNTKSSVILEENEDRENKIKNRILDRLTNEGKKLSLKQFGFSDIPEFVYELDTYSIEVMDLSSNNSLKITKRMEIFENLSELNISHNNIDVVEFPQLKMLLKLDMSNACFHNQIFDISCLPKSLNCLDLSYSKVISIKHIAVLTNLTNLRISRCNVKELGDITQLVNLKILNCHGCGLENIDGIGNLEKLQFLDLNNNFNLKEIPSEIVKLQELEKLYLYNIEAKSLPCEIEELQNLKKLYISHVYSCSVPYVCKMILNLSTNSIFTFGNIFPNLCEDMKYKQNLLDAIYPPMRVGFLKNLISLKLGSTQGIIEFYRSSVHEKWKFTFGKYSNIICTMEEEFQFTRVGNVYLYYGNGFLFGIPSNFYGFFNANDSILSKESVVSFDCEYSHSCWIIDDENTLHYFNNEKCSTIVEKKIQKILSYRNTIMAIDIENNVWNIIKSPNFASPGDIHIELVPNTKIPQCIDLKYHEDFFVGVDIKNNLFSFSATNFNYQNLSEEYSLPKVQFFIPLAYPKVSSYSIYIIGNNGNVWAMGYNDSGILGVGDNEKSWIPEFRMVPLEQKCIYIYQNINVFFLTESRDIYEITPGQSIPILSPYQYHIQSSQKSARK